MLLLWFKPSNTAFVRQPWKPVIYFRQNHFNGADSSHESSTASFTSFISVTMFQFSSAPSLVHPPSCEGLHGVFFLLSPNWEYYSPPLTHWRYWKHHALLPQWNSASSLPACLPPFCFSLPWWIRCFLCFLFFLPLTLSPPGSYLRGHKATAQWGGSVLTGC